MLAAAFLAVAASAGARAQDASVPNTPVQEAPAKTGPDLAGMSAAVTPAQAQQLLGVLQDFGRRQALIRKLETVAAEPATPAAATPTLATPAVATAAPPTAAPAVVTAPAPAPAAAAHGAAPAAPPKALALTPGGLGEQVVGETTTWLGTLSLQLRAAVRAATGFPAMLHWVRRAAVDPLIRERLVDAALKSTLILGAATAVQFAVMRLLRGFIAALDRAGAKADETGPQPDETVLGETHVRVRAARSLRLLRRLPGALLRAVLTLLPAVAFGVTANLLLATRLVELFTTKMIIVQASEAYVGYLAATCLGRLVFTNPEPHWRLIDPGDEVALYLDDWGRWLAGIAIFGTTVAEAAGRLGLATPAREGLIKIVALAVHIGLVGLIWRSRRQVRRKLQARPDSSALWTALADRLSRKWHWLASALVIASWPFWAFQELGGVPHMLRVTVVLAVVLILWRIVAITLLGSLDRAFRAGSIRLAPRADRYYPLLRQATSLLVAVLAIFTLLEGYGVDVLDWFSAGAIGARSLAAFGTLAIIVVLAVAAWEFANATIDRNLAHLTATGHHAQAGRLRTLAPLLRSCLMGGIVVVVGLTALSEIGINTGPLLAGAGIFGVALGFGSQRLVQDFITGIFLLLENAMQVGEWVTVSGLSGTVENLSIRTIRLRAGDGSVHLIPFSSVTIVTNTNRGIGNAAINVTVSAEEDVDRVGEAIKRIGAELQADPDYRTGIRSALELWGIDKLDASTVTLAGQIECTDAARWGVQREFNRRVKKRFAELGIRLANPAQAVLLEQSRTVTAWRPRPGAGAGAVAGVETDPGDSPVSTTRSPPPAALGHGG